MGLKIRLLEEHGIKCWIKFNQLLAEEVYTQNGEIHISVVDLTDYTIGDIKIWLGY